MTEREEQRKSVRNLPLFILGVCASVIGISFVIRPSAFVPFFGDPWVMVVIGMVSLSIGIIILRWMRPAGDMGDGIPYEGRFVVYWIATAIVGFGGLFLALMAFLGTFGSGGMLVYWFGLLIAFCGLLFVIWSLALKPKI